MSQKYLIATNFFCILIANLFARTVYGILLSDLVHPKIGGGHFTAFSPGAD